MSSKGEPAGSQFPIKGIGTGWKSAGPHPGKITPLMPFSDWVSGKIGYCGKCQYRNPVTSNRATDVQPNNLTYIVKHKTTYRKYQRELDDKIRGTSHGDTRPQYATSAATITQRSLVISSRHRRITQCHRPWITMPLLLLNKWWKT
jgi:hypothetical protein